MISRKLNISSTFSSDENSDTATNECNGEIAGVWEPFQVNPTNACGTGITCPLVKGQTYTYTASVTCPADAPSVSSGYV